MQTTALLIAMVLLASPTPPQDDATPLSIDMRAEAIAAAERVVDQDAAAWGDLEQPRDDGRGYFKMLYQDTYDPAALTFMAASAIEMYSAYDLRKQCEASEIITCSDPWPSSVQMDAMLTAGVYAGVIGLQRLAKTQWDVDLDEGWKSLLIWGGIAAGRAFLAAQNISDANALREFGR